MISIQHMMWMKIIANINFIVVVANGFDLFYFCAPIWMQAFVKTGVISNWSWLKAIPFICTVTHVKSVI